MQDRNFSFCIILTGQKSVGQKYHIFIFLLGQKLQDRNLTFLKNVNRTEISRTENLMLEDFSFRTEISRTEIIFFF